MRLLGTTLRSAMHIAIIGRPLLIAVLDVAGVAKIVANAGALD